jgi:hypothetical protein
MTKSPVTRETRTRRGVDVKPHGRIRTAALPDYQIPLIVPLSLFTTEDAWRLSAEAANQNPALQLRRASDTESIQITQLLRRAFEWAIHSDKWQEWEGEPQRKRRWYEKVERHADNLLRALDLVPEECRDPAKHWKPWSVPLAIHEFRQSLDRMASARPDLPDQLDALSRVVWDEQRSKAEGDGVDAEGRCQYRRRASFLVDRLPRTVALVSALARLQLEQIEHRPRGHPNQFDIFGRELFKLLAGAHEAIYGCKPLTRIKSGETIGGSIDWAKAVICHAADAMETSPHPVPFCASEAQILAQARAIAAPYVARFRALADLSPRRVGDRLEEGWRDWKQQVIASAR